MFAWLKDKGLLLFAIALELWKQNRELHKDVDAAPLPPIISPEGQAMRWAGEAPTNRDAKTVTVGPLKGSLADRMNQARKQ